MRRARLSLGNERVLMRGAWPISFGAALVAMALAALLIPMYFPTNDDSYVQQIMAGLIAPDPSGYISFINYGLGWLVSRLYAVLPGLPWWPLVQLGLLCASLTAMGYVAFYLARQRLPKMPRWAIALCLILAETGFFSLLVTRLQFTSTSSVLMMAALAFSCCAPDHKVRRSIARVALPVALGAM